MHENVRSLIIPFVLILNILLSSQWTICSEGTVEVQWGYRRGTVGVQWGTGGLQWGYSGGTGEKHKTTQHWYTFFIFIVTSCTQCNKRTWYDMLYMLYFL